MADQMATRWDGQADKAEEQAKQRIRAAADKRSPTSLRILRVLIAALLVAFAVWIPAEIWSRYQMPQRDPPQQTTPSTGITASPQGQTGTRPSAAPAP
jgi:cytoskeletal protein RodZ